MVKLGTETTLVVRLMDGNEGEKTKGEEKEVVNEDEKENEDANGGKDGDAYAFDLTSPDDVAAKKPAAKPVEASRKRAKTTASVGGPAKKPKAPAKRDAETRETAPPAVDAPTVYDYARVQLERRRPIHDRRRSRPPTRVRDRSENCHRRHPARRRPRRDRDVTTVAAVARAPSPPGAFARVPRGAIASPRARLLHPLDAVQSFITHLFTTLRRFHPSPRRPRASLARVPSRAQTVSKRYPAAARRVPRASRAFDMLALARAALRRARNLTPSSARADDADDADDAPGDADDGTRSSDSALETNAIVSPAVARAMESARLASIDPERAVMSSSTPIADAEDAEETLEAKGLVRTGSALRAVSADEAKRLNRMLSTDLREMMAAEVRGSRGSTLMRLTVRCPVVMMVISFSIWAGLGALALVAHPPKIETSLEGFQIRDHPTSTLYDGIDRGRRSRRRSGTRRSSRRRLREGSCASRWGRRRRRCARRRRARERRAMTRCVADDWSRRRVDRIEFRICSSYTRRTSREKTCCVRRLSFGREI